MELPKKLYEPLPYLYITVGIILLISDLHLLVRIAGILLYCVGCSYWVWRSSYRRDDRYIVQSKRRRFSLSVPVYEALPFIYILCGILLLLHSDSALELASGLLLVSAGALVWRIRYAARLEKRREMVLRNKDG